MKAVPTNSAMAEGVAVALPEGRDNRQGGVIGPISYLFNYFSNSRFKSFIPRSTAAKRQLLFASLLLAAIIFPHLVRAEDLLASQKSTANDTFGHGSTVEWYLYVGEILVSVFGYIKTRNPMVFGGLLLLMIVTRTFFAVIG